MARDGLRRVSPELRVVVENLRAESGLLVEATQEAVRDEVPAYGRIDDREVLAEVHDVIAENVRLWYRTLLDGRLPSSSKLAKLCEFARRRVHQGVPLDAMLHAFRTGGLAFWRTMLAAAREEPAIQEEVLFHGSEYMFRYVDLVSRTTAAAYQEEADRRVRTRDRAQFELSALVFRDDATEAEFRASTIALKIDAMAAVCALAVRLVERAQPEVVRQVGLSERAALALGQPPDRFVEGVRHGHIVVWFPAAASDQQTLDRADAAAKALLADRATEVVGVGVQGSGREGWRTTADQALRALELGMRLAPRDAVHHYRELSLYDVAARTPEIADLLRTTLERLSRDPDLIASLAAYFANGQRLKPAAAALGIHPNTLTYRLRRAEEALGARVDEPDWSLRLQLALKLSDLREMH